MFFSHNFLLILSAGQDASLLRSSKCLKILLMVRHFSIGQLLSRFIFPFNVFIFCLIMQIMLIFVFYPVLGMKHHLTCGWFWNIVLVEISWPYCDRYWLLNDLFIPCSPSMDFTFSYWTQGGLEFIIRAQH